MQEGNKKEKWGKPKLIILTRGKPEERMLGGCKCAFDPSGPDARDRSCEERGLRPCRACRQNAGT